VRVVGSPATRPRPLPLLVGAVVLVGSLFLAALTPLLPRYVEELGLSKTSAGILTGAFAAGALLGSFPSAWLVARIGARRTLLIGLALKCGAGLVFAFGQTILVLDVSRLLMGVGGACTWSGAMGWLVSATPPEVRGATIGRAMSAAVVGFLIGPVVGALARETGPELPFAAISLLMGALGLVALRFADPPHRSSTGEPPLRALRDPRVRVGAWLVTLAALALGALELLVPLRLDALGAGGAAIGATFLVAAAVEGIAQLRVGQLSDRRGRMLPIRTGLVGTLVALVLLPLPQTAWLLAVVVVLAWVAGGVLNTPAMMLLSDGIAARGLEQGVGFALVYCVWAGGQGIGSIVGGLVAARTSDAVVFLGFAVLCAVTLVALARRAEVG
jgi:predicted MFS family arabinose efflux permease